MGGQSTTITIKLSRRLPKRMVNISNLKKKATVGARWAPTSYPQLLIRQLIRVITPLITSRGPLCLPCHVIFRTYVYPKMWPNGCLSLHMFHPPKSGEPFPGCHVAPNKGTLSFKKLAALETLEEGH